MIDRREAVLGGLLTLVWGTASCSCPGHADQLVESEGAEGGGSCMIEDDEASLVMARSSPAQTFSDGQEKLLKSSGDKDLDYALPRTLARLRKAFDVNPGFAFFEGPKSNNAYATTRNLLKRSDGSVLFGMPYLAAKLKQREAPDAWVATTCAHEYGHILQYKLKLHRTVFAGQPTSKRLEMHADFLAGYFAGLSKLRNNDFPAAIFAVSRHAAGDFNTKNKGHHGTPDERVGAVIRGFETAYAQKHTLSDAVQIGLNYVSRR